MAKFEKGQSGNPEGRPKGIVDKRRRFSGLLEPYGEQLIQKAIELALQGDGTALRLCIERLIPRAKDEPVSVTLGGEDLSKAEGLSQVGKMLIHKIEEGTLSPEEALSLMTILEAQRRIIETAELAERLSSLEKVLKGRDSNEAR